MDQLVEVTILPLVYRKLSYFFNGLLGDLLRIEYTRLCTVLSLFSNFPMCTTDTFYDSWYLARLLTSYV